jgi:hypothetical protein
LVLVPHIDRDDPRARQRACELDPVLAQPADADDDESGPAGEMRADPLHGGVGAKGSASKWGRLQRVELAERNDVPTMRHEYELGESSIDRGSGLVADRADLFMPRHAPLAVAAPPTDHDHNGLASFEVSDPRPGRLNVAGDLVTHRHGEAQLVVEESVEDVQVRMTNSGSGYADENLVIDGTRGLDVLYRKSSFATMQASSSHQKTSPICCWSERASA